MKTQGPATSLKFLGVQWFVGVPEYPLQIKRQIDASFILYHKEGSSAPGRPLWSLEVPHSTPRNSSLVTQKVPAFRGAWSRRVLYKSSKLLSK